MKFSDNLCLLIITFKLVTNDLNVFYLQQTHFSLYNILLSSKPYLLPKLGYIVFKRSGKHSKSKFKHSKGNQVIKEFRHGSSRMISR